VTIDSGATPAPVRPPRIDAHHHFWDIESGAYDWPTPDDAAIHRTFRPEDLEPELAAAVVERTVLVQVADTLADTDAMLEAADRHAFIAGVVAWLPLADARATEAALDTRAGRPIRGARHLIQRDPDPEWLLRPTVADGLRVLEQHGLPFDVVAFFPRHLDLVPTIADRHPDLVLVIDHLAKPPFRTDGWDRWQDQLRAAAARPNVVAKLSGLQTAVGPDWTAADLRPAVDAALEAFGTERLLFGSDWPVCLRVADYADVIAAMDDLMTELTADERAAIMGATASRVYRLA
jgi:L-fuconolactonase